jgi:hypothetical protein
MVFSYKAVDNSRNIVDNSLKLWKTRQISKYLMTPYPHIWGARLVQTQDLFHAMWDKKVGLFIHIYSAYMGDSLFTLATHI